MNQATRNRDKLNSSRAKKVRAIKNKYGRPATGLTKATEYVHTCILKDQAKAAKRKAEEEAKFRRLMEQAFDSVESDDD